MLLMITLLVVSQCCIYISDIRALNGPPTIQHSFCECIIYYYIDNWQSQLSIDLFFSEIVYHLFKFIFLGILQS